MNFLDMYSKNTQMSNFMKIPPVEAEFHADRRTDGHDEANSCFSQFLPSRLNTVQLMLYSEIIAVLRSTQTI